MLGLGCPKQAFAKIATPRDPETGKLHRFVTTLPMTINPGTIAMLYFKRWTIQ
ncbi:hypothetical protein [Bathymodiolus japonicus methanotrophic gill symbiont]|uniref:hypothetical protein n=1 Tax=Bathymodiolus japonicus methanotrophic gill symbiont TaxID=113269 RepID=UPI001C8DBDD6|nr:hypothetical protein [Bathymodiolus japonicus methanotrophic gill symbiont]